MKHLHPVSKTPSIAMNQGGLLAQLVFLLQTLGELRELAALINAKKGGDGS